MIRSMLQTHNSGQVQKDKTPTTLEGYTGNTQTTYDKV